MALNTAVSGAKVIFTNAFNIQGSIPLDARVVLEKKTDLNDISNHFDVNGNNVYLFPGIQIYCKDVKELLAYIGPVQNDGGILISDAQTLTNWKTIINGNSTGDISTAKIIKSDTPTDINTLATYKLVDSNGTVLNNSISIDIPKDKSLQSVEMGNMNDTIDSVTGIVTKSGTGNACLEFVHQLNNGSYSLTKIDVSELLKDSQFGQGLKVSSDGVVSVNKTNETYGDGSNKYLVISENNIDLNGIVNEFKSISSHTINGYSLGSNPNLNGADVKLNGYSQSTGTDTTSLTILSTDTINLALGKIAKKILDSKTINGQNNESYTVNTTANYINVATDMNNADVILDNKIKINSDNITANKISSAIPSELNIVTANTGTTIEVGTIDLGTY